MFYFQIMDGNGTSAECEVRGCPRKRVAHGICGAHYAKMRRGRSLVCEYSYCERSPMPRRRACEDHYMPSRVKSSRVTQAMTPCKIDGCTRPSRSRNICSVHDYRIKHGLRVDAPVKNRVRNLGKKCKVRGCDDDAKAKLMCTFHYSRYVKSKDIAAPRKRVVPRNKVPVGCKIGGCEDLAVSLGMCATHYARQYNGMDVTAPVKKRVRNMGKKCKFSMCNRDAKVKLMCYLHYGRSLEEKKNAPGG